MAAIEILCDHRQFSVVEGVHLVVVHAWGMVLCELLIVLFKELLDVELVAPLAIQLLSLPHILLLVTAAAAMIVHGIATLVVLGGAGEGWRRGRGFGEDARLSLFYN